MSDISLSCRNLVKFLGEEENRVQALREVSLELKKGMVYSIVGPSGCGKSTLLYLLGLLDQPDSGEIFVGEKQSAQLTEDEATRIRNEHLGFIFQFHFLLKEFTAAENVMLPMIRLGKLSDEQMKGRAQELLDAVGIGHKSGRRANHLSGGEQQRVAIARALANQPEIILADEPTGNLDSLNSDKVFDLLKKLAHDRNITILVVTHNPAIAKASDVVLEMRDGSFI
jgi:lipoprotein-releasing system ATP-binding protein